MESEALDPETLCDHPDCDGETVGTFYERPGESTDCVRCDEHKPVTADSEPSLTARDAFTRGVHAGNYANAYTSESLPKAWKSVTEPGADHESMTKGPSSVEFRAGFVWGFFSSYELHEVPFSARDEYVYVKNAFADLIDE